MRRSPSVRSFATVVSLDADGDRSVLDRSTLVEAVTKSFRYAAYGEIVQPNANVPTLLGFTGELRDSSGLIYLRARWYDPGTGRFMSRDPFRGSTGAPTSLNGFAYAAGRPTAFADPAGLDPSSTGSSDSASLISGADLGQLTAFLLDVGAFVGSDYVRVQGGVRAFSVFGARSSYTIDRYGNVYFQPLALSAGTPGANVAVMVGWLLQITKPSERDLRSFLEGPSYMGGTSLGAGVNVVTSPFATGTKVAAESGIGPLPFAGVSGGTSIYIGKLPLRW